MDPFIGTIILFAGDFAPRGWSFCDGQLLEQSSNETLFSILGTTYGGETNGPNGVNTFKLPDLRGRVPVHAGHGPGLSPVQRGQRGGANTVALSHNQMPSHTHIVPPPTATTTTITTTTAKHPAFSEEGTTEDPSGAIPALTSDSAKIYATASSADSFLAPYEASSSSRSTTTIGEITPNNTGGNLAHENMQPYLGLNYIIATTGLYPTRS